MLTTAYKLVGFRNCANSMQFSNLSKNLKVKAVVLDARNLIGKTGIDTTSTPVEKSAKKEATYDVSNEIVNVTSIQAKYMKKIRDKGVSVHDISRGRGGAMSDGQVFGKMKDHCFDSNATSSALSSDMLNIIHYIYSRGLQIALFGQTSKDARLIERICDEFRKEGQILHHFMINNSIYIDKDIKLKSETVSEAETTAHDTNTTIVKSLTEMEHVLKISPGSVMMVTSDPKLISVGCNRGYNIVKYRYCKV